MQPAAAAAPIMAAITYLTQFPQRADAACRAFSMSCLLIFMLFMFGEVFEKIHSGGGSNRKFGVVTGCEHPAAFGLRMDGLDGQFHGFQSPHRVIRYEKLFQPRPNLNGLPILPQSHQRGHYRLHGRSLLRWYLVLRKACRRSITSLVPINGRQGKFFPFAGPGKMYLYFCVTHDYKGMLMSTKSAVSSVSMAFSAIASRP
ncbi:hypothetical protein [Akkermansia phage Moulinsart]|nr:hypothetical protein [Akkermansia phage Moulinsart]